MVSDRDNSAEGRSSGEGCRFTGQRNCRGGPGGGGGNVLGNGPPGLRVPPLGYSWNGAIGSNEDESRERIQSQTANSGAIGIGKDQEFLAQRSEKLASLVGRASENETCPGGRTAEGSQNARCCWQDPRTLVGEWVEDDRYQMKGG